MKENYFTIKDMTLILLYFAASVLQPATGSFSGEGTGQIKRHSIAHTTVIAFRLTYRRITARIFNIFQIVAF